MKPTIAKSIFIEWREPTKEEKHCLGRTYLNNSHVAKIFVNNKQSDYECAKTFWHELVHVFYAFHNKKITKKNEEGVCRLLEDIIMATLGRF